MTDKGKYILVSLQLVVYGRYGRTTMALIAFMAMAKDYHPSSVITDFSYNKIYKEYGISKSLFKKILAEGKRRRLIKEDGKNLILKPIRKDNGENIKLYVGNKSIQELIVDLRVALGVAHIHSVAKRQMNLAELEVREASNFWLLNQSEQKGKVSGARCNAKGVYLTDKQFANVVGLGETQAKSIKKECIGRGLLVNLGVGREHLNIDKKMQDAIDCGMVDEYADYLKTKRRSKLNYVVVYSWRFTGYANIYTQSANKFFTKGLKQKLFKFKYAG